MTLKFSTTGRPFVECPKCKKIHGIYRKGDYLQVKVFCSSCKTTWKLEPKEVQLLKANHEARTNKNEEMKRLKQEFKQQKVEKKQQDMSGINSEKHESERVNVEKEPPNVEKPVQVKDEKPQKNLEKPQKDKPKKSWLEGFLGE